MENILNFEYFLNETKKITVERGSNADITLAYLGRNGGSRQQRDFGGYFNYALISSRKVLTFFSIQCDNSDKFLEPGNTAKIESYIYSDVTYDYQFEHYLKNPIKSLTFPITKNYEVYTPEELRKSGHLFKTTGDFHSIKQIGNSVFIKLFGILYPADLSIYNKLDPRYSRTLDRQQILDGITALLIQEYYSKPQNWTKGATHKTIKEYMPTYNSKNGELDNIFKYIEKNTNITKTDLIEHNKLDKLYTF